eukprot:2110899-Pyramimonas_sp.AAC.1
MRVRNVLVFFSRYQGVNIFILISPPLEQLALSCGSREAGVLRTSSTMVMAPVGLVTGVGKVEVCPPL